MSARAFRFDANRCTGCRACELACAVENDRAFHASWRQVYDFNPIGLPGVPSYHLSLACNHCEEAPCMAGCPALAYTRDESTGAVLIEGDLCIGCGYCAWVCPYEAPRFDEEAGVMSKCDFCEPRLHSGGEPACVSICPTGALGTTSRSSLSGVSIDGFPETPYRPAIEFDRIRGCGPDVTAEYFTSPPAGREGEPGGKRLDLRTEWPLAVFTLAASFLVSWLTASARGHGELPWIPFLLVCVTAMATSTVHLGKPGRAWRAILNVKRSWLSREVALFGAFTIAGFLWASGAVQFAPFANMVIFIGFALLFSIDRVYDFARRGGGTFAHSADVLLSGIFIAWVLMGGVKFVLLFAGLKAGLYLLRKLRFVRQGRQWRPALSALRLAGLIVAVGVTFRAGDGHVPVLIAAAVGEIVDRAEFYMEMEIPGPTAEIGAAVARRARSV